MENIDEQTEDDSELANSGDWAQLFTLCAECLKHPDEQFFADVEAGLLDAEIEELTERLDLEEPEGGPATELLPESAGALDNEYIRLFEGLDSPYANPVESPYKEWHPGTGKEGLLQGPPAEDMQRRYEAIEAEVPDAYEADHLALLLDYAALLVDGGRPEDYRPFLEDHFDWLPAFRRLVDDAAAEAPFHRWAAGFTCEWIATARRRLGIPEPDPAEVDEMTGRFDPEASETGVTDEKEFRE